MNSNKEFIVRLFDELEPCYPDSRVSDGYAHYSVAGANGTYAGVNILMSGLTPGIPVCISVEGENTAFKLFRMLPVPVEVNTGAKLRSEYLKNDYNENVIRRAPFMVYEALEPIYNIVMAETTTMAICFKSIIEYCREPRTQLWKITVTHDGQSAVLTFDVEQYPFEIQKAGLGTHKFVNWFSLDAIASYHHIQKWSREYDKLLEKYMRAAVFSRQNMAAVPLREFIDISDKNECVLNVGLLKRYIDISKKAGMTYFQGGAVAVRELSLADDDDFYSSIDHSKITCSDEIAEQYRDKAFDYFDNGTTAVEAFTGKRTTTDEAKRAIASVTAQLYAFIKENALEGVWVQCALDEPNDALCDTYKEITSIIRKNMPSIPILEPVLPTQKVVGALDIWCPSLDVYQQNQSFFDDRVSKGDRLFVYSCLTPGGNWTNRLLDLERLRIVWLGWAPAKYTNIEGFLHWGANQFNGADAFKRSAAMFSEQILEFHPKRAMFLPAGDHCIFYPGTNEPLISVRSEAHRIGLEDLFALKYLSTKDDKKTAEIVEKVFRSYCDYEKSVEKYRQVKRELLEQIHAVDCI